MLIAGVAISQTRREDTEKLAQSSDTDLLHDQPWSCLLHLLWKKIITNAYCLSYFVTCSQKPNRYNGTGIC